MTAPARCVILALCTMAALAGPRAQSTEPAPNKELEALQAHFQTTIGRRHDQLFTGISTRRGSGSARSSGSGPR